MRIGMSVSTTVLLLCASMVQARPTSAAAMAALNATLSVQSSGDNIHRFDMQPAGGVTKPGYTAVTNATKYTPELGYGFTNLLGAHARDGGRLAPLSRDFISATQANFRVDVPNGVYDIWIQTGDSQLTSPVLDVYFHPRLIINGKTVYRDDTPPADFYRNGYFKHYYDFWHPGMSYYDTFILPHFHKYHFEATVTNGHLAIEWRNLPMDGMIISPVSKHAAVAKEWAHLKVEQREGAKFKVSPDRVEPMPQVTSADEARGFILFRRPANVEIYPTSRPKAGERIDSLKAFAAQGQTEGMHFSLFPVKDLGTVAVRATAFHNQTDDSQVIPVNDVTVRVVRYNFYQLGGHDNPAYYYKIAPYVLDTHEYVPCPKGTTWTWWVNVKVPPQTPAGVYQGDLRIEPRNAPAFDVPVKLTVLGIKLAPLPIIQGYYYWPYEPWYHTFRNYHMMGANLRNNPAIRAIMEQHEKSVLAYMKSLGLNSVAFDSDLRGGFWTYNKKTGHLELTPHNAFVRWMDIYAQSGMSPMYYYDFQAYGMYNHLGGFLPKQFSKPFTKKWIEEYRHLVTYLNHIGKQRGWPEILWCISDETGNKGLENVKLAVRCAKLLEGMEGVTTISTMNHSIEKLIVPHVDIAAPNFAFPITPKNIQYIHDSGTKFWIYNCGTSRLTLGLYPWRIGATGRWQWEWNHERGDMWDDLDGGWGDHHYNLSLLGPHGPVGTLRTETLRQAIYDHRYVATLEAAIAAAKSDPAKADVAKQASEYLANLRKRIPVDLRALMGYHVSAQAADAALGGEFRNTDRLIQVRSTMARYILKLGGGH